MTLQIQAQALYDVLEAIFDYADVNLEPRGIGLLTAEKEKFMVEQTGMSAEFAPFLSLPVAIQAAQYRAMECPMYLLPAYNPRTSPYDFREPDQPALTKPGWIKAQTIALIIDGDGDITYRFIQGCISSFDLRIKNPSPAARLHGGRYMPLPEKSTVEWYATSLAPAIGIAQIEGLKGQIEATLMALLTQQDPQLMPHVAPQENWCENWAEGGVPRQYGLERERILHQERENGLSDMRVKMSQNQVRGTESMGMMSGLGIQGSSVKYSWEPF